MDKFLNLQKAKCARLVTAHQRHSEYPLWTHVSGSKLFCTPCNKMIDHLRKSSVDSHRKSADHRSKEDKMKEAQCGGETVKKQRTLDSWPKSSDSIWWYSIRPDCFLEQY
ncbi:CGG triplet repeat-binding protein 1 [Plakobranchus ocellatus]|uniref:CGG triplet repeat-binding protein 1 n=1 Tax=Plakobranchus ocellatus TaxID=259542 RepID=A0AAV4E105_9GAST|nr:CGG triplet repeat-binding protein 1 [Plakobranchus ocellatus]